MFQRSQLQSPQLTWHLPWFRLFHAGMPRATGLTWRGQAMPTNLLGSDKVKVEATQEEVRNETKLFGMSF